MKKAKLLILGLFGNYHCCGEKTGFNGFSPQLKQGFRKGLFLIALIAGLPFASKKAYADEPPQPPYPYKIELGNR